MFSEKRPGIAILTLMVLTVGCVAFPPSPPPSILQLEEMDTEPLRNKTIVIDPGHGGGYRGAVGRKGLRESEVNLGVGLYLWGLLESAGARPFLTRTADTTVESNPEGTLIDDLQARCNVANQLEADLFVSIHHNASADEPCKNSLEIYYKLSDDGPSLDIANDIVKAMRERFVVEDGSILPGNFFVLRNTKAPAILGEASYMTNKGNEKRLNLHAFLRLEAECYFLGILNYFSKGVPTIEYIFPSGIALHEARPEIGGILKDEGGVDPASIQLVLDGKLVSHTYDPQSGKVSYIPRDPLASGSHFMALKARNRRGNAAYSGKVPFPMALPPAKVRSAPLLETISPNGFTRTKIRVRVEDAYGNPVADGNLIKVTTSAGFIVNPFLGVRNGMGTAYLISPFLPGSAEVMAECQGVISFSTVHFMDDEVATITALVADQHGDPIENALFKVNGLPVDTSDERGYCFGVAPAGKVTIEIGRQGYHAVEAVLHVIDKQVRTEVFQLEPMEQGLLFGKSFFIDPLSCRDLPEGAGCSDAHEHANLQTARHLAEFLSGAGADIYLAREGEEALLPAQKVIRSGELRSNWFISISHHSSRPSIAHYYRSPSGAGLARSIQSRLMENLKQKRTKVVEGTAFTIVHTEMPSVLVDFSARPIKKGKDAKGSLYHTEALALYRGIVDFLEKDR